MLEDPAEWERQLRRSVAVGAVLGIAAALALVGLVAILCHATQGGGW